MSKAWKELAKRAAFLYPALTGLENLSTSDLRGLRAVCCRVTSTNCAWTAHSLAPLLRAEIDGEFYRRAQRRKRRISARDAKS